MDIKNRFTGKIIISTEGESLSDADFSDADLSDANLRGANLSDAKKGRAPQNPSSSNAVAHCTSSACATYHD